MPEVRTADGGTLELEFEVRGPWSLRTSAAFWEGFTPAALPEQRTTGELRSVFIAEGDWTPVTVTVTQRDDSARLALTGAGDLENAAEQVRRFLSIDIDGTGWPDVGRRDPVIERAQRQLPGFRPCGFHSPYEAAAWAVLSQRIQMRQAARIRTDITARHGEGGAFPAPQVLRSLTIDLPGRKGEYLHAVADAALEGLLDGSALRALPSDDAIARVQSVKGLGPFAAELVVIRGANAPDVMPRQEARLSAELTEHYGEHRSADEISEAWKPFRSWAAVHLRALREDRTHEIGHRRD